MRGRRIINRNPEKTRHRKTRKAERSTTPKTARAKSSVADLQKQLDRQARELEGARQQQAASSEVLHIISASPGALTPVFKAIVKSAVDLCGARFGAVFRMEGDLLHLVTDYNFGATQRQLLGAMYPMAPNRGHISGRTILTGSAIQIPDIYADEDYKSVEAKKAGFRSLLAVPLLQSGRAIGSIVIYRTEPGAFTARQSALLQTFADQAVIAIENVRLFDEVRAKTEDLTESLQQQTATSEVLRVISSSPGELQPVFDVMLESATRMCAAKFGILYRCSGDALRTVATYGAPQSFVEERQRNPIVSPNPDTTLGRALSTKQPVQIADILVEIKDSDDRAAQLPKFTGARTVLAVPMVKGSELLGAILIYRQEVHPFTDKQIELVENFAAQAAIAIENTRLLNDLRESLQQQTATADVLKVISRSAFDLQSVFDTLTASATQLCEADYGIIFLRKEDTFYAHATSGAKPALLDFLKANPRRLSDKSMVPRVARTGAVVHIPDRQLDPEYEFVGVDRALGSVARAMLGVPLLRNGTAEGVFVLGRYEPKPFTQRQIELIESFSDQAVIAIENVRLFDEVQARTKELAASLDDLRTAQDRLIQTEKLASLGQLTAGIAHEIKNPLNFVNNFSALSAELIEEMKDVLSDIQIDNSKRSELEEIAQTLKSNLEKVVQHGKRADSIVKNMLLHSREGSGEHRSADINALVEESLNLAYHGARAEKPGFNVVLKCDLDPDAGAVELYPQEITRALLNLISNGFYAATQRKSMEGETFEPVLIAATKNLGKTVEIRIRDNGTGIPEGVKEKIFNPFFTTKPSGEGTGLGLSMSHDIIVKQHGGSIDVETEPGRFTEFKIVLLRTNQR